MMRERIAAGLLVVLMLAACAQAPEPVPTESSALVWPSSPDPARIAYVRSFARPDDLGIGRSLLQRLSAFVFGEEEMRLIRPMAVVTVGKLVYVADPGAKGVHRFDPVKGRHDLLRLPDGSPMPSPVGLAKGFENEVYVTDSVLGRVYRIGAEDRAAREVEALGHFGQPTGIACDRTQGTIWVVDTAAHRIAVFDRSGKPVTTIGERGGETGKFNYPTLLWRSDRGRLYVTDSLNFRIQMFDGSGRFLGAFGRHGDGTGDAARQKGVAADSYGHIYIVDSLFHAVQIFDEQGRFLLSVGGIGHARGEFWLPTGIFIDEDDTIYVADSYNQRVQVFRYIGGAT